MIIHLPYGNSEQVWDAPERAKILTSGVDRLKSSADGREIVRDAAEHPIGSPRLRKLAAGKKTCTVIISDHTRPVPSRDILPVMLEELRAGNPDIDITLLAATGCHRLTTAEELKNKVGEEIASKERIVVHNCQKNNVEIGTLPSGAPLVIDRLAAETDLLVSEGFVEPHFFAGFSGGRKSVLPGVCDRVTVLGNHCSMFIDSPCARTGVLQGNPIHRDMVAAARMAKLAFIVNVVIDEKKKTVAAFAGDFEQAHLRGTELLREYCAVKAVPADISVTTNGGAPLDQNIYQCVKSMTAAEATTRPGGVIILCAECADGTGGEGFYRSLRDCESVEGLYDRFMQTPQNKTIPDQWESQILARILKAHPVIMVTNPKLETTVEEMKMRYAATVEEAFETACSLVGAEPDVTVIPNGIAVIVEA